ncbi:hypothetical protein [Micromonospora saelicesensis]|uniref:hypothetical protein n=1 Tax=Micromonospora saelicesensis TaxID=285676 RepID=UPI0015EB390B|nr:hypothetical protein [Micromonospora saelicesensis]
MAGEPEPVGPIAEQLLDDLAAQDADLADRRRDALRRLGRANTTNPLVRRQH